MHHRVSSCGTVIAYPVATSAMNGVIDAGVIGVNRSDVRSVGGSTRRTVIPIVESVMPGAIYAQHVLDYDYRRIRGFLRVRSNRL